MLRVPSSSSSSSTTPFVVMANPANPFGRLGDLDEVAVATKADNPKKRAVIVWNDTLTLEAKNHGKSKLDHTDKKLERYYLFAFDGKDAVLLNKHDAEGAFVVTQKIKEEAAKLGAASYAPFMEGQDEEDGGDDKEEGEHSGSEDEDGNKKRKRAKPFEVKKQEFGSKKQQTRVKRMLLGRISGAAVAGADELDLGNLVRDESEDDDEDGESAAAAAKPKSAVLPPYDLYATEAKLIYPSTGYFPPEERAHVQLVQREFSASKFAQQHHTRLVQTTDEETKQKKRYQERENLVVYFELLMRMQTMLRGRFVASVADAARALNVRGMSDELVAQLLSRFLEAQPAEMGGGFAKTKLLTDKLCVHLLIVALALDDYVLSKRSVQQIAADLRVDTSALAPLLAKLGCKSGTEAGNTYYKLVAPLKFPVEMRRRARRKA